MLCPLKLNTTPWQVSASLPAFTVGAGKIVTINGLVAVEQPVAAVVSITLTEPAPAPPHVTVIEFVPAPAVILPPTTSHIYELPITFGVE
jgi:hypothetical protein